MAIETVNTHFILCSRSLRQMNREIIVFSEIHLKPSTGGQESVKYNLRNYSQTSVFIGYLNPWIQQLQIKNICESEGMAQWVTGLLHKDKDLPLILTPRTHIKMQVWWHALLIQVYLGGRDRVMNSLVSQS